MTLTPSALLAAACCYYGLAVFYPATAAAGEVVAAEDAGKVYREKLQDEWRA